MHKSGFVNIIGNPNMGKSTLMNGLLGKEILATGGLRNDDRGRHTTTRRQMFFLPGGAALIAWLIRLCADRKKVSLSSKN